jgi:hypothetical protein
MMPLRWILLGLACGMAPLWAQVSTPFHVQRDFRRQADFFRNDTVPHAQRTTWVSSAAVGSYGLAMLGLGALWYSQEDLASFHFFDDSHQWRQMDKVGHAFSGYQTSSFLIRLYRWSGQPKGKALAWSAGLGMAMVSSIEVFDGFGESWGFSWPDIAANGLGVGLSVLNYGLWNEERLKMKIAYHRSAYATNSDFHHLFGRRPVEWWVKDYNGHTFWLSARVHSFLPEGRFKAAYPRWLNLAVGYGAEGLEGGYHDPLSGWQDREYRQLYLSLDVDLSQIETRSAFLNSLFAVVSIVRIPFPTVRWDRQGWTFLPLE